MNERTPNRARYLHRRLFRITAMRLGIFLLVFFVASFVFDSYISGPLGTWIADHTSSWEVYWPSSDDEEARILGEITASNLYARWDFQTNPTDGSLWARDLTFYYMLHDLWLPATIILCVSGCLVIVGLSLRKALSYFDELEQAVEGLMNDRQKPVVLSRDLQPTENGLNAIRERTLEAERESQLAEERKNELVAYLAHDIRTPLTSVIGYLQLLSDSHAVTEEKPANYLKIALSQSESLNHLIGELFDITRLNLSSFALEPKDVDICLLCVQVAEDLYPQASARNITLDVVTDGCSGKAPQGLIVSADGMKLARAVGNVVRNAIAYADYGSRITIRCEGGESSRAISVSNVGNTIPPEHVTLLFDKFYREDEARSTSQGGAGLGLAIAREIVEAHGGSISVVSADRCTTFTITLPISEGNCAS